MSDIESNNLGDSLIQSLASHSYGSLKQNISRVHVGITCEYCRKVNFESDRYCCSICIDYNLCTNCFCSGRYSKTHQLRHPVLCISSQLTADENEKIRGISLIDYLAKNCKTQTHTEVTCSLCKNDVIGLRIKCDECYDTDLCYACWKTNKHANHPMILYIADNLQKIPFHNITFGKTLGGGYFGTVYEAFIKPKNDLVACKVVDNKKYVENKMNLKTCIESIFAEMNAHTEIRSAFVCKLIGYSLDMSGLDFKLCIIMEYMHNGSLSHIIKGENERRLSIPLLRKIKMLGDIAGGLVDIHRKRYIHADLKPENILVTLDYTAKISDFGIVKNRNIVESNPIGSYMYMPPEFYTGKYDNTVDIYSFGLVAYNLMTGYAHKMYQIYPLMELLDKIEIPNVKNMITECTDLYPFKRRNIKYHYKRLRSFTDVFMKVLELSDNTVEYNKLNTEQKNGLLFALYNKVIDVINSKLTLQNHLSEEGYSQNEINLPIMDEQINKLAVEMNDIANLQIRMKDYPCDDSDYIDTAATTTTLDDDDSDDDEGRTTVASSSTLATISSTQSTRTKSNQSN